MNSYNFGKQRNNQKETTVIETETWKETETYKNLDEEEKLMLDINNYNMIYQKKKHHLDEKLKFGKFKGKTYNFLILTKDPYIEWLDENKILKGGVLCAFNIRNALMYSKNKLEAIRKQQQEN